MAGRFRIAEKASKRTSHRSNRQYPWNTIADRVSKGSHKRQYLEKQTVFCL
jgi:hypothetical protein